MQGTGARLTLAVAAATVAGCASTSTDQPSAPVRPAPTITTSVTPTPPPTTDPELVANAEACTAPDPTAVLVVRSRLVDTYRLTRPALHVTAAVGTDPATGDAGRYTYLGAELRRGSRLVGPAVWAAVDVHAHAWVAVNTLAEHVSGWPSADGTDAAVQRNLDDYSRVVSCTAEGGFPGGPEFSVPPDDQ